MPTKRPLRNSNNPKTSQRRVSWDHSRDVVSQFEDVIDELNNTVPSTLQRNLELIRNLDVLIEGERNDDPVFLDKRLALIICQTKQDLAWQTYELIDNNIMKVDELLTKLEALPKQITKRLKAPQNRTPYKEDGDTVLNMAVDPNEPTYCICGQVAFGEMISCDSPNCDREWFHVQCVGKPERNSSDWYCPNCVKQLSEGS